jgi:hypothetical protein
VRFFKSKTNWSALLLGIWLVATGLLVLVPRLNFSGSGEILAVLAIATGVCLVMGR